jgi:hypothetical protein
LLCRVCLGSCLFCCLSSNGSITSEQFEPIGVCLRLLKLDSCLFNLRSGIADFCLRLGDLRLKGCQICPLLIHLCHQQAIVYLPDCLSASDRISHVHRQI